jgi:DNA-binding NarL/FixJ family response regulator
MSIRIVLADDHGIFVAGLRSLLEQQPDMEVIGDARDGLDAVNLALDKKPDVVVMDVSMPGMNGIEATHQIRAKRPETKVLCLSMHSDKRFVAAVLEAGASGYLLKECALEELIRAVRTVMAGQTYLSPPVAGPLVADYKANRPAGDTMSRSLLTDREREVLQLLAEGHTAKAIAGRLEVSVKTVSTHREHVMRKLDIHSVAGLTKYAIREGLTSTDPEGSP